MIDSCSKQLLEHKISHYRDLAIQFSRKADSMKQQEILRKSEYNNLLFIKDTLMKGPDEIKKEKRKYAKKGVFQTICLSIFILLFQGAIDLETIELFFSLVAACTTVAGINGFCFYKFNLPTIRILKNNTSKVVECNISVLQDEINRLIDKKENYQRIENEYKDNIKLLTTSNYRDLSSVENDLEITRKHAV